ncbi:MAG: hypothetical protein LBD81_01170 [Holosporaceae bacterium]|nr:hypothetical protein [Holosporaceae bacterium]
MRPAFKDNLSKIIVFSSGKIFSKLPFFLQTRGAGDFSPNAWCRSENGKMHKIVSKKFDQIDWGSGGFDGELEGFSGLRWWFLLMDQDMQVVH